MNWKDIKSRGNYKNLFDKNDYNNDDNSLKRY